MSDHTATDGRAARDRRRAGNDTGLTWIGTIFLIGLVGELPAQGITGMVSNRCGPRTVLLSGMILLGTGTLVFAISHNLWLTFVVNVFMGGASARSTWGTISLIALSPHNSH